jgi:hypothetical protein
MRPNNIVVILNIILIKGYLLQEDFQRFWGETKYPAAAEKFLDNGITRMLQNKS